MKSEAKFIHFYSRKCIWKFHLENGGHFVSASMCYPTVCLLDDNTTWWKPANLINSTFILGRCQPSLPVVTPASSTSNRAWHPGGQYQDYNPHALSVKSSHSNSPEDQAAVPLTTFWSNSKFDQNLECSSLKYAQPITTIFCTCHHSHDVCKMSLWLVALILNQSTASFGRMNSIENTISGTAARNP